MSDGKADEGGYEGEKEEGGERHRLESVENKLHGWEKKEETHRLVDHTNSGRREMEEHPKSMRSLEGALEEALEEGVREFKGGSRSGSDRGFH